MIDKDLELKIKRVKEFMQLWIKFHDMYKDSISREAISPEDENTFLETKSLIARKYQALKNLIGDDSSYDDRTLDVILQVLSLQSVSAISDVGMRKIENDWHNSYIQLNKLLGNLEGRQEALRRISRAGLFINTLRQNALFNLVIVVIIIFGLYLVFNYAQKAYKLGAEKLEKQEKQEKVGTIEFQKMEK